VDAVEVRAHDYSPDWPEAKPRVRVGKGHDASVHRQNRNGYGAVVEQEDTGDERHKVRHMNQRMRAKYRQGVHVLLRVMEFVEPPQHLEPVIGEVNAPVASVHGDEDDDND
jgi:hypothetical protein